MVTEQDFYSSPGLGIGITVAFFQHSGISPDVQMSLNISIDFVRTSGCAIRLFQSLA